MSGAFEVNDRVYYRENGRSDRGTVTRSARDSATVKWDVDGSEEEYDPTELKLLSKPE